MAFDDPIPDDPPDICHALFPALRGCVYLDTGSAGLAPRGMGEAAAAFYDDTKSLGYRGRVRWQAKAAEVRTALAAGRLLR